MGKTPREDLLENLKDVEFAELYGAESAKVNFGITLMKARRAAKLTQKELAGNLGVSLPYLKRLETGETNPTLGTVGILLASLGLEIVIDTIPLEVKDG